MDLKYSGYPINNQVNRTIRDQSPGSRFRHAFSNQYQDIMVKHDEYPHRRKIHYRIFKNPEKVLQYYTVFNKWMEIYDPLNPKGTFNNAFADELEVCRQFLAYQKAEIFSEIQRWLTLSDLNN